MTEKLKSLHQRLLAAQRQLISATAECLSVPSDNTLRKIADFEVAIGAVEAMIEDGRRS